ncbi:hypothetical protein DPMN_009240 [Dreissena polymorpha]|uniref:Uncharacterized protein n=1 Tax=Dreissena polymorpha TaxID=45954 RepID=A0A9D4MWJ8_DREPO|nr:hypothetical protein DPMN_009240 [Dreissena polymorpha]
MARLSMFLDNQFHQFPHQEQALQVPRSFHSTLRLRDLDVSRRHRAQDTDI